MPFYAINKQNTVCSSGHGMEAEAKREALQVLGGLTFETVANMSDTQVDQMLRSMASQGVRVLWSDIVQQRGKAYRVRVPYQARVDAHRQT